MIGVCPMFKFIILSFFTVLNTACCYATVICKPTSDDDHYVILSKNLPFASQLKKENTTYEIRCDFDLKRSKVTIPKGSALRFEGGKLYNGIINLNDCYIEGNARFECDIEGCPANENIYTKWFASSNNELFLMLRNFCSCWYNDKVQVTHHNKKRIIHEGNGGTGTCFR